MLIGRRAGRQLFVAEACANVRFGILSGLTFLPLVGAPSY